ncbi:IclR family transcriptional regulator [Streptomyces broussonetiae]|uniref:Helix-turn-helix domain-containing protein n=1 Tax=Streptomyces broussonetiae TaxID=2686304 RepID=A0A6I6MVG1_9ACTN|nr:helix-turn-helix domain-containing protein [Streptomyces broussonetiae]QHA02231.1 helix-turn-helix domain-containing protein [Streptomyces broussonetiae]
MAGQGSADRKAGEPPLPGRSVLEGAFALLESLADTDETGLAALAASSGLPKTTAYRLLDQLVALGAVERRGTCYRTGSRMFRLGRGWQPHPGLRAAAQEPLRQLAGATGASVCLCVLREGRTMAAAGIPGIVDELAPVRAGATWPWTTAAGRLLVATGPKALLTGPLPPSWKRQAAEIQQNGVALDREELIPGVCCVAVPVAPPRGEVVGALCAMVEPERDLRRLTHIVTRAGRAIGAGLRQAC